MALYPTIKPISVSPLAVVVICPACGSQESQRMMRSGRSPIQPGDKVLFRSICSMTTDLYYLHWGFTPNQIAYYIQFPARKSTP